MGLEVSDNCQDYKTREIKYVNDFSETGSKKINFTLEEISGDYIVHKKPKPRQKN